MKCNNLFVPDVVSGGEPITLHKCHQEQFVVTPGPVCWCLLGSELDWRGSGEFLVHTPSPGHQQLPCTALCPWCGLEDPWLGTKANILLCFPFLPLSLSGALLMQFNSVCIYYGHTEQLLILFFFSRHMWIYFFSGSLGWTSHFLPFVSCAWLPPLSPCLCY